MDKEQIKKLRAVCKDISVLYVEDDKTISQHLEKLIKKIFVHVDIEKNGLLGLENFRKNRQDIVITDISMPVMDGIEMSKRIKLINGDQNILVTSAHNDIEYLLGLIEIGIDKFIMKPIDMMSFLSSISKIAIAIYREKREVVLESRLRSQQELQTELLDNIILPVAYFEEDAIVYANSSFKKQFFTNIDVDDANRFRLGYLFQDKKYVSMSNSAVINEIGNSKEKIYELMDINKKAVRKYNLSVSNFKDKAKYLVSFVNLDAMYIEFDRFNNQINYFPKRESFAQAVLEYKSSAKEKSYIFCIGIKNVKKFIDRYGGSKMHSVYNGFAKSIKKEFSSEIEDKMLSVYLFETNRYVLLAEENSVADIEKKLEDFGKKYNYDYGSGLSFELNIVKEEIDQSRSLADTMENTEGMLYTLE